MSDQIISVRDLRKEYRMGDVTVAALRGVDLDIDRGEFVSIVGPSGSGKSTLFHVLGGLTPATSGTVLIDGQDLAKMSQRQLTDMRKSKVGFVFQKYNLLPTLSARDNIAIAQDIAGKALNHDRWFSDALKLLGIDHRLDHKPRAMSGGEQQRIAIARAIVNHPALLLADEPTGNLDGETGQKVIDLMFELRARQGTTLLLITHDPALAQRCGRTVHLLDGRIRNGVA